MDEVIKLLPCPFCGAELRPSSTGRPIFWHRGVITDRDCIMAGRGIDHDQVAAWNERALDRIKDQSHEEPK